MEAGIMQQVIMSVLKEAGVKVAVPVAVFCNPKV